MASQCRPPRPTTFLTTHCRPTNMDFVGFSFFIPALLGVPILNFQSFLYTSKPTKFSYSHFELTKFFSMNFHVVCLQGTFIRELLAQLVLVIFSPNYPHEKPEWFSYFSYAMVMNINSGWAPRQLQLGIPFPKRKQQELLFHEESLCVNVLGYG